MGAANIDIATAAALEELPATASDGNNFVVWTDYRTDAAGDVYGGRIAPSGALLDGTGQAIGTGLGEQTNAGVTFWRHESFRRVAGRSCEPWRRRRCIRRARNCGRRNARSYWYRDRNRRRAADCSRGRAQRHELRRRVAGERGGAAPGSIHGARVSTAGSVLDATGFVVSSDANNQAEPSIAGSGGGATMVAYRHFDSTASIATDRIRARTITGDQPTGTVCANGNICNSGICVDGVCCNALCGNGDPTDCQACSIAAGGTQDGTCTPIPTTHQCRAQNGICDVPEMCDGVSAQCPVDGYAVVTTICRAQNGPCDVAEHCTGADTVCPPDVIAPSERSVARSQTCATSQKRATASRARAPSTASAGSTRRVARPCPHAMRKSSAPA